jgi:phage replication O-like protein O
MADVQPEHGHIRIANALWDAWCAASLTATERRALMAIVRQSYGFGRKDTGTWASLGALERYTGMGRTHVSRAVRGLVMKGVVLRLSKGGGRTPSVFAPCKDYDRWAPGVLPDGWAPVGVEVSNPTPLEVSNAAPLEVSKKTPHKNQGIAKGNTPTHTTRAGGPATGPTEAGEVAVELWRLFAPRGPGGGPKSPSAIALSTAMDIVEASGADRAREIARAVGKAGWGWAGFLRCFDDDGTVRPEEVPGARKRTGGRGKEPGGETREERQRRMYGDE